MSSWMSRQQRRQRIREMAKAPNLQAAMDKLDQNSQAFEEKAMKKIRQEIEPQVFKRAQGEAIVLVLAVLHLHYKHRGPWLENFLKEFVEFSDQMLWDGVQLQEILDMLKEETGVDFLEATKKLVESENQRRAERTMTMRYLRKERMQRERKLQNVSH